MEYVNGLNLTQYMDALRERVNFHRILDSNSEIVFAASKVENYADYSRYAFCSKIPTQWQENHAQRH